MPIISDADIIRCEIRFRNPLKIESMPLLVRLHQLACGQTANPLRALLRRPARDLHQLLLKLPLDGQGKVRLTTPKEPVSIPFGARSTLLGPLYLPQHQPVYRPECSAVLERLVRDDQNFVDVGAGWGWFSLLLATRPGYRGKIQAFEPAGPGWDLLNAFVRAAGLEETIDCHDVILTDRDDPGRPQLLRLDALDLAIPSVIRVEAADQGRSMLIGASAVIDRVRPFIVLDNRLHRNDPELTQAPIAVLDSKNYRFFFPGWTRNHYDYVEAERGASTHLTLVPFLPAQRFLLPPHITIVAVPEERLAEFKLRF